MKEHICPRCGSRMEGLLTLEKQVHFCRDCGYEEDTGPGLTEQSKASEG